MAHSNSIFAYQQGVEPAILALADGTVFKGRSIGAAGHSTAEIVFNTSMVGYQELLTDPSSAKQIITFTYPHIGNSGVNSEDVESSAVQAAGVVLRSAPVRYSNFRAEQSLLDYLKANGIVAICDVDTRKLTRILRESGPQAACILAGDDEAKALELARAYQGSEGQSYIEEVSRSAAEEWTQTSWTLDSGYGVLSDAQYHVVAYDFGVANSLLRLLADRDCRVTVVPASTSVDEILALNPDGIFMAGGPGDPAAATDAIESVKQLLALEKPLPIFALGLGFQILALAAGAKTQRTKVGGRGFNHPVKELATNRANITSQNYTYVVDKDSLPAQVEPTHISLFDGSVHGIQFADRPVFGYQGQPVATTAPNDDVILFDQFINLMANK